MTSTVSNCMVDTWRVRSLARGNPGHTSWNRSIHAINASDPTIEMVTTVARGRTCGGHRTTPADGRTRTTRTPTTLRRCQRPVPENTRGADRSRKPDRSAGLLGATGGFGHTSVRNEVQTAASEQNRTDPE